MMNKLFLEAVGAAMKHQDLNWEKLSLDEWLELFEIAGQQHMLLTILPVIRKTKAAKKLAPAFFVPFEKQYHQVAANNRRAAGSMADLSASLSKQRASVSAADGPVAWKRYSNLVDAGDERTLMVVTGADVELLLRCAGELSFTVKKTAGDSDRYSIYDSHQNKVCNVCLAMNWNPTLYIENLLSRMKEDFLKGELKLFDICNFLMAIDFQGWKIEWNEIRSFCDAQHMNFMVAAILQIGQNSFGIPSGETVRALGMSDVVVDESPLLNNIFHSQMGDGFAIEDAREVVSGKTATALERLKARLRSIAGGKKADDRGWEEKRRWVQEQLDLLKKSERKETAEIYGIV